MSRAICTVEGCTDPIRNVEHGLCNRHYLRFSRHGDVHAVKIQRTYKPSPNRLCTVEGCEQRMLARGYCGKHYQRWQHHGDPTAREPEAWPPARVARLAEMLEAGWSNEKIGKRLGISAATVVNTRKRLGIRARYRQHHTANAVATLMGTDVVNVIRWIQRGLLKGHKNGARYGRFQVWQIDHFDLLGFIQDPASWCCYDPRAITDPAIRAWATELRGDVRFITPKELGYRLGVPRMTVLYAINAGRIPATRDGWLWHVRESDVPLAAAVLGRPHPAQRWTPLVVSNAPPAWSRVRVLRRAA